MIRISVQRFSEKVMRKQGFSPRVESETGVILGKKEGRPEAAFVTS
jgi:hypothetical protein